MIRKTALILAFTAVVFVLQAPTPAEAQGGRKQRKAKQSPTPVAESAPEASASSSAPAADAASPSAGQPSPEPDSVWREVEPEILAYAIAPARATLARAKDPAAAGTLVAEGRILTLETKYADAVARFDRAAASAPDDPAPLVYKGEAQLYARQEAAARQSFAEAKRRAQRQVDRDAGNRDALYHLGVAQQRLGEHDAAYATLERARALAPGDERILYQMGATRFLQQRWQPAFDLMTQALERNARLAYAYWLRGNAAGQIDRKDVMLNDLRRFVELAPDAPEAERARRTLATLRG
ncbi:MAG TPA: hypothetical protein VMS86_07495 [Thermoanaerobaculia bacterium]|nr:hypothetical protein [Thermoanaerobaculia bacterium]